MSRSKHGSHEIAVQRLPFASSLRRRESAYQVHAVTEDQIPEIAIPLAVKRKLISHLPIGLQAVCGRLREYLNCSREEPPPLARDNEKLDRGPPQLSDL